MTFEAARCGRPTTAWGADDRRRTPKELVETVAEAHAGLSEVAFKLRRALTPEKPCVEGSDQGRA